MRKYIISSIIVFVILTGLLVYDYGRYYDGKLHIIFCNVGQGDAIFVRTPGRKNILIDGGPDKSVLTCLANHTPFWERTLHLLLLSHPHEDHLSGIHYVIDRYITLMFATVNLANRTAGYRNLSQTIEEHRIPEKIVSASDKFELRDGVIISILSPNDAFLRSVSPQGVIGETNEQASLIQHISYGSFDILLTGDNQVTAIEQIAESLESREAGSCSAGQSCSIEVIQVPHHGSRTGLNNDIIQSLKPQVAVISVGKNNYGHPSREIMKLLVGKDIMVLRTDEMGDIEIISDGKGWYVRRQRTENRRQKTDSSLLVNWSSD